MVLGSKCDNPVVTSMRIHRFSANSLSATHLQSPAPAVVLVTSAGDWGLGNLEIVIVVEVLVQMMFRYWDLQSYPDPPM